MCAAIAGIREDGRLEGRVEGRLEGIKEGEARGEARGRAAAAKEYEAQLTALQEENAKLKAMLV